MTDAPFWCKKCQTLYEDQCTCEGSNSALIDGLDANSPKMGLVDSLIAEANMHGGRTADLLRVAADRIDCMETAAKNIVNGTEHQDARTFRKGLNGFKILLGI